MEAIIYLFSFVFGTIIGSFLNVVIVRFNTGTHIGHGRSRCLSCATTLRWFELIPIISFLALGGRCSRCESRISLQYIAVEVLTGIMSVLVLWKFIPVITMTPLNGALSAGFFIVVFSILLVISVYDIRHMIIPNEFVYVFIVFALGFALIVAGDPVLHIIAGIALFGFFGGLWLISHGRWIGLGDAKLALGVGLLFGIELGISALIVAFWTGALIGLLLVFLKRVGALFLPSRYRTLKGEMPFGPYIVFGAFFVFLFEPTLLDIGNWLTLFFTI